MSPSPVMSDFQRRVRMVLSRNTTHNIRMEFRSFTQEEIAELEGHIEYAPVNYLDPIADVHEIGRMLDNAEIESAAYPQNSNPINEVYKEDECASISDLMVNLGLVEQRILRRWSLRYEIIEDVLIKSGPPGGNLNTANSRSVTGSNNENLYWSDTYCCRILQMLAWAALLGNMDMFAKCIVERLRPAEFPVLEQRVWAIEYQLRPLPDSRLLVSLGIWIGILEKYFPMPEDTREWSSSSAASLAIQVERSWDYVPETPYSPHSAQVPVIQVERSWDYVAETPLRGTPLSSESAFIQVPRSCEVIPETQQGHTLYPVQGTATQVPQSWETPLRGTPHSSSQGPIIQRFPTWRAQEVSADETSFGSHCNNPPKSTFKGERCIRNFGESSADVTSFGSHRNDPPHEPFQGERYIQSIEEEPFAGVAAQGGLSHAEGWLGSNFSYLTER